MRSDEAVERLSSLITELELRQTPLEYIEALQDLLTPVSRMPQVPNRLVDELFRCNLRLAAETHYPQPELCGYAS